MEKIREAHAKAKQVRISPNKARQVLRLIAGKDVNDAVMTLRYTPKKAARFIEKVLNSAVANAENNLELSKDNLYVAEVFADQGPTLKRFNPVARGRAMRILKRTSHITIILDEVKEV